MTEEWRPIPGFEGRYEVSSYGRVRSVKRIVVRSNGMRYTVKDRIRRICVDKRNGSRYIKLATGVRGRYHTVYMNRLMADVFGTKTPANNGHPPANNGDYLANADDDQAAQQTTPDGHFGPLLQCITAGQGGVLNPSCKSRSGDPPSWTRALPRFRNQQTSTKTQQTQVRAGFKLIQNLESAGRDVREVHPE